MSLNQLAHTLTRKKENTEVCFKKEKMRKRKTEKRDDSTLIDDGTLEFMTRINKFY